jgi:hypothetical protein
MRRCGLRGSGSTARRGHSPRGVIHSFAGEPITDTAPLTRKRMETIDEEVTAKALDFLERMFTVAPAGAYVANGLQSFKEFPPRQKPGSFNLERVMETVTSGSRVSLAVLRWRQPLALPARGNCASTPARTGHAHCGSGVLSSRPEAEQALHAPTSSAMCLSDADGR